MDDAPAGRLPQRRSLLGPPAAPITDDERRARIEKARRLMAENGIDAMLLEGGTSMYYFTGVRWGNSERTFAVVIPAQGRARVGHARLRGAARARADQVLERRARLAGGREPVQGHRRAFCATAARRTGKVGMEERVRFFIYRRRAPGAAAARSS